MQLKERQMLACYRKNKEKEKKGREFNFFFVFFKVKYSLSSFSSVFVFRLLSFVCFCTSFLQHASFVDCGIREEISRHSVCWVYPESGFLERYNNESKAYCPLSIFPMPAVSASSSSSHPPPPPYISYYYPTNYDSVTGKTVRASSPPPSFASSGTFWPLYRPDWMSLDKRPLPEWYDEVKFGIFIHWGVYTVPSNDLGAAEWFWEHLDSGEKYVTEFMNKNNFSNYQDFVQDFHADLFNATRWVNLAKEAGAKYIVVTSKHHDGYCLWDSTYSFNWNSVDLMPHRHLLHEILCAVIQKNINTLSNFSQKIKNIMQRLAPSFFTNNHNNNYELNDKENNTRNKMNVDKSKKNKEEKDLLQFMNNIVNNKMFNRDPYKNIPIRYGLYYSLYEWYHPLSEFDRHNNFTTDHFVLSKTLPELYEIIHKFLPSIIWSDGDWEADDKYWKSKEFLTYMYDYSPARDYVVTNDRWGEGTTCIHGGFVTCADRYKPYSLMKSKYENCLTIDRRSWGYRRNADVSDYLTIEELLEEFVASLAYGSNYLLNISPSADGKISAIYQDRVKQIAQFVRNFQQAIYFTTSWSVAQQEKYSIIPPTEKKKAKISSAFSDDNQNEMYRSNNIHKYSTTCEGCSYSYDDNNIFRNAKMQQIYFVVPTKNHQLYTYNSSHFEYNVGGGKHSKNSDNNNDNNSKSETNLLQCIEEKNKKIKKEEESINLGNSNGIIYAYFSTWPDDNELRFKNIIVDENTQAYLIAPNNIEIPLQICRKVKNNKDTYTCNAYYCSPSGGKDIFGNNSKGKNTSGNISSNSVNDEGDFGTFVTLPSIKFINSKATCMAYKVCVFL